MLATSFVSVPILAALVGRLWDLIWDSKVAAPIPARTHNVLSWVQAASLVVLAVDPAAGVVALSALYAAMAVGLVILRSTGAQGDCGCFGSTVRTMVTGRLVAFDALLAVVSATVLLWPGATPTAAEARIGLLGAALAAVFITLVLAPGRRLIADAAALAAPYRRGVLGYRDVPEATT